MTSTGVVRPKLGWLFIRLLPVTQRRTAEELSAAIDLGEGDTGSKQSAYWTMLVVSGLIATAGVIGDSTATVIGAMIIAPLGTPIMAMAFAVIMADTRVLRRAAAFVFFGMLVVVTIGLAGSLILPESYNLLANPQISSRTAPTLIDMLAAIATGFAGAVGLVRRDVSDVLPGVAIAISLVPPLAVAGICWGQGSLSLAVGAFLLFASNVLAMVVAGTIMFAASYLTGSRVQVQPSSRRPYVVIGSLFVLIMVPLGFNTLGVVLVDTWSGRIQNEATTWLSGIPNAEVRGVEFSANTATVDVLSPSDLPSSASLLDALKGQVPSGIEIVIDDARGERIVAGPVP